MKDTTMRKPERFDENEPLLENGVLDSGAWRAAVAPEELRETLLEQTCAAVRFRARRRRMLLGGAVAAAYAAGLFAALRSLERGAAEAILAEWPEGVGVGCALRDRLFRASEPSYTSGR